MSGNRICLIICVLLFAGCKTEVPGGVSDTTQPNGELVAHERNKNDWELTRSESNPLISTSTEGVVAEWGYKDINGPSVVRVPEWVVAPLGTYYLYFAHHRGSFIRMAYADELEGPWTIHEGGVLSLEDTPALDHIASPDVYVDDNARKIRMYFHSVDDTTTWKQTTYLAISVDGLQFESGRAPMGPPYLRVFKIHEQWWAVAKRRGGEGGGMLLRANGPDGPFEEGPLFLSGMRHATVLPVGDRVELVFSRIGDEPERLLRSSFQPVEMWADPFDLSFIELMKPEFEYEGAEIPVSQSAVGESVEPVNALRDPYVFIDSSGETALFYSIAGENGIAMAWIEQTDNPDKP